MKFMKKHPAIATAALSGFILLSATCGQAQERDDGGFKLRTPFRYRPFSSGMTAIDPPSTDSKPIEDRPSVSPPVVIPQPQRSLVGVERTANGTIQRFSDGSTIELKPECITETLCNGTKIEKLPEGTTIVRWPNGGGGIIRYSDGTGAAFHPDPQEPSRSSDLSDLEGTVEVLPGGVVRQTLKNGKTAFDRYPDGTIHSPSDLLKPEAKTSKSADQPVGKDLSVLPLNPFSRPTKFDGKKPEASKLLIPIIRPTIRSGAGRE